MDDDQTYVAPELTVVGTVESLTAANHRLNYLDGNYPAGTPVSGPITS